MSLMSFGGSLNSINWIWIWAIESELSRFFFQVFWCWYPTTLWSTSYWPLSSSSAFATRSTWLQTSCRQLSFHQRIRNWWPGKITDAIFVFFSLSVNSVAKEWAWLCEGCSVSQPLGIFFKFFGGYHCIWRYREAQGVQEVQKNTFGKYRGIPR